MIKNFLKKGGKINEKYLKNPSKGPVLVFFKHRWYRGKNLREAMTRAQAE